MKIDELVKKYIEGRDKKAALKQEFDAKVAKIDAVMEKIESAFLSVLDENGMETMRTDFGTAMVVTRTSVTVADKEAFMEYVTSNQEWPLLEVKPSKTAVVEFKEASGGDLPPGLNWRSERTVQVRRAS